MVQRPAIETTGLSKYYGTARGVVDLNLTVDAGTIFGFLGPNGAGKTTTIRLLLDPAPTTQTFGYFDIPYPLIPIDPVWGLRKGQPGVIIGFLDVQYLALPKIKYSTMVDRFTRVGLVVVARAIARHVYFYNMARGTADLVIVMRSRVACLEMT
ncbi:MAG TPA: ATP-binding cassette domain-containing protein [Sneathiellales bacterium]|nr:ATP-binding cassette domain-containing protein [Sneathiellales bacterium]